jgi:response regulator NasT
MLRKMSGHRENHVTGGAESGGKAAREPATLLLVEDDLLVLATLARGLRDAGFRVLEADDGAAAIEIARRERPALALIDQQLPRMPGLQIAERLCSEAAVPFIFVTACSDPDVIERALLQGALAYLVKPLDIPQIVPTVRAALTRAREIDGLRAHATGLATALRQGREVSMAVGLLMARLALSQEDALERLRTHARDTRARMEDLARSLIAGHEESAQIYRRIDAGRGARTERRA